VRMCVYVFVCVCVCVCVCACVCACVCLCIHRLSFPMRSPAQRHYSYLPPTSPPTITAATVRNWLSTRNRRGPLKRAPAFAQGQSKEAKLRVLKVHCGAGQGGARAGDRRGGRRKAVCGVCSRAFPSLKVQKRGKVCVTCVCVCVCVRARHDFSFT